MISLYIPIYNAQDLILNNYRVLKKQLEDLAFYDYGLLFEDDASTDKSRDVLEELAASDPNIKVSSHYSNRGIEIFSEDMATVSQIKSVFPSLKTVCLGYIPSIFAQKTLKDNPFIDFIIMSEP